MEITCDSCQSKFKIADEKIPAGKTARFPCPKCKSKITIKPGEETQPAEEPADAGQDVDFGFEEEEDTDYESESADSVFDFTEEEGKVALVCESDAVVKEKVLRALDLLEYHVVEAKDNRDALRKMRYKVYDAVVVDEYFSTKNPDDNGVVIYIQRLTMDVRRKIFVALISDRFRTMDYIMAFNKSVNIIVNKKNMDDVEKILARNIAEYEMSYRIYKELQE
jgi:predicted Zn finger-like uncharacterized protein